MIIALFGSIMIQGKVTLAVSRDGSQALIDRIKQVMMPSDMGIGNFEVFLCPPGHSATGE